MRSPGHRLLLLGRQLHEAGDALLQVAERLHEHLRICLRRLGRYHHGLRVMDRDCHIRRRKGFRFFARHIDETYECADRLRKRRRFPRLIARCTRKIDCWRRKDARWAGPSIRLRGKSAG